MKKSGQWVPVKSLLPALDADGKQRFGKPDCMLFLWEGIVYEERDPCSLSWFEYGKEWDVMLCMQPYE